MLLKADGRALATRHLLAMSPRQVAWFIDPEALLRHVDDLKAVKVAAYCQSCYGRGLPDDITATFDPQMRAWTVRCACADYPLIKDAGRGGLQMTKTHPDGRVEVIKVWSVDDLLFRLGWSFRCAGDCARLGMHDGVQGHNDPTGHKLSVVCGCTERIYLEASAA